MSSATKWFTRVLAIIGFLVVGAGAVSLVAYDDSRLPFASFGYSRLFYMFLATAGLFILALAYCILQRQLGLSGVALVCAGFSICWMWVDTRSFLTTIFGAIMLLIGVVVIMIDRFNDFLSQSPSNG